MFQIKLQYIGYLIDSRFFDDKDAALKAAKEMAKNYDTNKVDWLTLYSGCFGSDHEWHANNIIYDFYIEDECEPVIYEQK